MESDKILQWKCGIYANAKEIESHNGNVDFMWAFYVNAEEIESEN